MLRRNPYTFIGIVALGFAIIAVSFSVRLDIPMRDPEGFLGPAYVRLPLLAMLFFAAGIIPQAIGRYGFKRVVWGVREVIRTDWTWARFGYIAAGLLAFYTSYVSYRNLKGYLPELRPPTWDLELERFDHWLFFGNYPSDLLHSVMGTGIVAQIIAVIYVSYLMLIPITLGAYLVLNRDISIGAWYATALSLNWILGTISYYILPTVGPAFAFPTRFEVIDGTPASELQRSLFRAGRDVIENEQSSSIYGIAGFASLHVSVVFTACLFFTMTKIHPLLRTIAWVYFAGTVLATVYFGWHYVSDDLAGLLIGVISVYVGAWATGNTKRQKARAAAGHPDVEVPDVRPHPEAEQQKAQTTAGEDDSDTVVSTA
ncbi:phosphatase PAP2 family protein [Aeromicrobium alkaliterrae]|uniref:Inositolphosphotransferase Aur1/Ipt1 domain-containing protein n=1 Tax=Aeromicrobium alkaliterrae TaxID=302168 RepID=A0ABP4VSK0_9ACTN